MVRMNIKVPGRKLLLAVASAVVAVLALSVPSSAHAASPPVASSGFVQPVALPAATQLKIDQSLESHGMTQAQAQPLAASQWYSIWILSEHNGLCAAGQNSQHLSPIDMYGCEGLAPWACRVLNTYNGWNWDQVGQDVECVDPTFSWMFGESGGAFKLETINASDFMDIQAQFGGSGWYQIDYYPNDNYWAAGPANDPVGVSSSEVSGYGWTYCGGPSGCPGNSGGQPE